MYVIKRLDTDCMGGCKSTVWDCGFRSIRVTLLGHLDHLRSEVLEFSLLVLPLCKRYRLPE